MFIFELQTSFGQLNFLLRLTHWHKTAQEQHRVPRMVRCGLCSLAGNNFISNLKLDSVTLQYIPFGLATF